MTGATLCAFSGYMIVGGQWYIFSTEMVHILFLLYSVERFLSRGDKRFIPPAAALVAAFVPFNLYMANILVALFILVRSSELLLPFREAARKYRTVIVLQLAGCAMAAVFLLPNLHRMITSPRGISSGMSFKYMSSFLLDSAEYYTTLAMRFFSTNLIGTGSDFTGWQNYLEAPLLQCGLLCILMIPLFIIRNRSNRCILLAVAMITAMTLVPGIRYAVWLFKGDYFRSIALIITIPAIYGTSRALDQLNNSKSSYVSAISAFICAVLTLQLYRLSPAMKVVNSQAIFVIAILAIYLSLFLIAGLKGRFDFLRIALIFLVPLEMIVINYPALNSRQVVAASDFPKGIPYNDDAGQTIDSINSKDRSFYRIHKDFSSSPARGSSLNDSMVQDYNGITIYGSFNHLNMVNFMDSVGVIDKRYERRTRWLTGLESSPILMNLLSVKYILSNGDFARYKEFGYLPVLEKSSHVLLAQNHPLPFGFTYSQRIDPQKFSSLPPEKRQLALMKYCVLPPGIGEDLPLAIGLSTLDTKYSQDEMNQDIAHLKESSLLITSFKENQLAGKIVSDREKLLFFSMPFDSGWKAAINGKPADLLNVNGGLTGLLIGKGESVVELKYRSHFLLEGAATSILSSITYLAYCILKRRRNFPAN
jgi:uncharacterized membrane protein YfhO